MQLGLWTPEAVVAEYTAAKPPENSQMAHAFTFTYDGGKTKTLPFLLPTLVANERIEQVGKIKDGFVDVAVRLSALPDVEVIETEMERGRKFALSISRAMETSGSTVTIRPSDDTPANAYEVTDFPARAPFLIFNIAIAAPDDAEKEHEVLLTTGDPGFTLTVKVKRK